MPPPAIHSSGVTGTTMPQPGVVAQDARDSAAYLATLD